MHSKRSGAAISGWGLVGAASPVKCRIPADTIIPESLQPVCSGIVVLDAEPGIMLLPAGKEKLAIEELIWRMRYRREEVSQQDRFRRLAKHLTGEVVWCGTSQLLLPAGLAQPFGTELGLRWQRDEWFFLSQSK